jgi:hypothetical protein
LNVDGEWRRRRRRRRSYVGVTKSISVDDSHLLVVVPSEYPERIPSVDPGGVQPEMGLPGRRPIRAGGIR